MSGHEARFFGASIDDPDSPHHPAAGSSLRRDRTIDNIFVTMRRLGALHHFAGLSHSPKCPYQQVRTLFREAKRLEEFCFATIVRMR
jgi:hypothetical protein